MVPDLHMEESGELQPPEQDVEHVSDSLLDVQ